jgi:hypothetical protein
MPTEVMSQTAVCPEYQLLLETCQRALATWQRQTTLASRLSFAGRHAGGDLKRLQAKYAQAYTVLEHHEQSCRTCQYVSKIVGLDFESMSSALNRYRRFS